MGKKRKKPLQIKRKGKTKKQKEKKHGVCFPSFLFFS